VFNAKIVVGGRVTGIHWIPDTRRVRVWIQIHTHEHLWVWIWVEFCLAGMDSRTIYPCTTHAIAIPNCKRILPGRRTTRVVVPFFVPPCVPSRADPSGLGHAATIYSSVQGPPGGRNADTAHVVGSGAVAGPE
jgi:hypothetical protein